MRLWQKSGQKQYYLGWYGMCDENGSFDAGDSDANCQVFDLVTNQYEDSGATMSWSNYSDAEKPFREQIFKIAQVQDTSTTQRFYDMVKLRELRTTYQQFVTYSEAIIAADDAAKNPPNSIHGFDKLVCGKAYMIIVNAGSGGSVGAQVSYIDIPEFTYTVMGDADTQFRLSQDCGIYP